MKKPLYVKYDDEIYIKVSVVQKFVNITLGWVDGYRKLSEHCARQAKEVVKIFEPEKIPEDFGIEGK